MTPAALNLLALRSVLRTWPRRRAGKIAHLPPAVREQINLMLQDGLTYAQIIARLGHSGRGLNKDNLSRRRKADHQDWLREQLCLEATRDQPQLSRNVPLQQVCLLLADFDIEKLREILSHDPRRFLRLFSLLPKLCETMRQLERLRLKRKETEKAVTPH